MNITYRDFHDERGEMDLPLSFDAWTVKLGPGTFVFDNKQYEIPVEETYTIVPSGAGEVHLFIALDPAGELELIVQETFNDQPFMFITKMGYFPMHGLVLVNVPEGATSLEDCAIRVKRVIRKPRRVNEEENNAGI